MSDEVEHVEADDDFFEDDLEDAQTAAAAAFEGDDVDDDDDVPDVVDVELPSRPEGQAGAEADPDAEQHTGVIREPEGETL